MKKWHAWGIKPTAKGLNDKTTTHIFQSVINIDSLKDKGKNYYPLSLKKKITIANFL